jgi:endonuclease YncB( thermonuclease family)
MNFDNRWQRDYARRNWNRARFDRRPKRRFGRAALIATTLACIAGGLGWVMYPPVPGEARAVTDAPAALFGRPATRFTLCHSGGGTNCVVDGDTFRMRGEKIRIADIDTPETHPARCAREAELGEAATHRLHALLNSGTVSLETAGRDADRYGRKLRLVSVDGRGVVGEMLVAEGLARPYAGGYRSGWCD